MFFRCGLVLIPRSTRRVISAAARLENVINRIRRGPICIRPARNEDLEIAAALVQRSINDLWSRHGYEASMPLRPPAFQAFCLSEDATGLWIAEDDEAIIGFGFSWTLADFWFLAQLFIEPGKQARGVGGELLQKTLLHAERLKATNRALITFAFNTSAIGLYTKYGLYPRQPLYRISAPASVVQRRLRSSRYACSPIAAGAPVDWLGQIDSDILGFRRDRHHEYLLRTDATGFRIEEGGSTVGYAYASPDGHIGPLAVAPGADSAEVVSAAMEAALSLQPQQLSLIAPGGADALMAKVVEHGFHIVQPLVLMSARSFGDWRNYVPRDPGYM